LSWRITGGYRYDFGTKLIVFGREDCALCWEGATSYTYSFAVHAKSDIDWSDVLSRNGSDIDAVCRRVVLVFNEMWMAALRDKDSMFLREPFSFLFGGYSSRRSKCMAWHIERTSNDKFSASELSLDRATYIGSGKEAALEVCNSDPATSPYSVLRQVINDPTIDDVGGVPQAYVIGKDSAYPVGTIQGGERFVFGRRVLSSGHSDKVHYVPEGEDIPVPPDLL
jgi:hypothetical protein